MNSEEYEPNMFFYNTLPNEHAFPDLSSSIGVITPINTASEEKFLKCTLGVAAYCVGLAGSVPTFYKILSTFNYTESFVFNVKLVQKKLCVFILICTD